MAQLVTSLIVLKLFPLSSPEGYSQLILIQCLSVSCFLFIRLTTLHSFHYQLKRTSLPWLYTHKGGGGGEVVGEEEDDEEEEEEEKEEGYTDGEVPRLCGGEHKSK